MNWSVYNVVHMFNLAFEPMDSVQVAFDTQKKVIHMLEVDHDKEKSLSDLMEQAQRHIVERIKHYGNPCNEVKWLVYDLKGRINEYCEGQFSAVELAHPDVYSTFASKIKVRRLQFNTTK
jgi:hypothetical protein